ncbi:MAG: DUF1729 domain-containing protein [Deltaproteobacteria bacterium]|nr:DUF1729 domain-containing protein [Deltaproteobacteria bacterium]
MSHAVDTLLAHLGPDNRDLVHQLWSTVRPEAREHAASPDHVARLLLDRLGEAPSGWESQRIGTTREALLGFLGGKVVGAAAVPRVSSGPKVPALLEQAHPIALVFGGQASDYLTTLAKAYKPGTSAASFLDAFADRLETLRAGRPLAEQALYMQGIDFRPWVKTLKAKPRAEYLASPQISLPLIFAAQMAELLSLLADGYDRPAFWHKVIATSGHSQGLLAALCVNETLKTGGLEARALQYAEIVFFMGLRVAQAVGPARISAELARQAGVEPTAMASVRGFSIEELDRLASDGAYVALDNTWQSKVVSGRPEALERLRRAVQNECDTRKQKKSAGRYAGRAPDFAFEYLPVGAPFHTPLLTDAADRAAEDARAAGFALDLGALPVAFVDGYDSADARDPLTWISRRVLVDRVQWTNVAAELQTLGAGYVLDLGPGDTVAKMTMANMRGRGALVLAVGADADRKQALDTTKVPAVPARYETFAPKRTKDGRVVNRFTEATSRPPVIVPGMTPTTVEVPLVAAAANAGYVAELAGGGQVTEAILRRRLNELSRALVPGQGVVFNALYLDPYLWRLHFGDRLVQRLRDEGYPLIGVTVSAGVPPKDEAVALLRDLHAHGLWLNAFKPGNDRQIADVLQIVDAVPELTVFAHIEGGKAGGHHSWEDLDDLLARHYPALRQRQNLVVCVGGGIADEAQATAYLTGTWSERFGLPKMPVDAVFLGTRLMAAKEALTSPQVKQALAQAAGTAQWVLDGSADGDVTSGRSQLDAAIYYMENAAAKAGRLLDEVAGKPEAIAARRDEIIAALAMTAKPYFGDVEAMTYAQLLSRLVELTAIGRGGAYEDGVWPDVSYRARFADMLRAAEARLGAGASVIAEARDLDEPRALVERFVATYPDTLVHPEDARVFLALCKRPGKPVCFVPAIDSDVRKWYKSDSLWQAHDARYAADQVLAIPGPEAVRGIRRVDEPVAEILAGFERAIAQAATEAHDLDKRSVLARALVASDAAVKGDAARLVPNPMRTLFAPRAGRTLETRTDAQGRMSGVIAKEANGAISAEATLVGAALSVDLVCGEHRLPLALTWSANGLVWDRAAHIAAQAQFYAAIMGGEEIALTQEAIAAFVLATADDSRGLLDTPPLNMSFALAWPEIYRALFAEAPDMLALVHEENRVKADPAWPLVAGDATRVTAKVTRREELAAARRISVVAEIFRGDGLAATVESVFFVRARVNALAPALVQDAAFTADVGLKDSAERDFLLAQAWLSVDGVLPLGETLSVECARLGVREGRFFAAGVLRAGAAILGRILLADAVAEKHPVEEVCKLLQAPSRDVALPEARPLGLLELTAPSDMRLYAHASGDHNPLHTDRGVAAYAGFDAPIVHGMWTASAALHRAVRLTADGDSRRLTALKTRFVAPVQLGDALTVSVRQVAVRDGGPIVEIDVHAVRESARVLVLSGQATFAAPKTAYAFPGQGIQAVGMGMEAYNRSPAARGAWDEADRVCRERLGFSILTIVRTNPREIVVDGVRLSHPKGALFLTQFTQVAMAVMAVAQVRELKERGAFVEDARFCGHSVGEYSALAAICEALPLPAVVELVYHRGLAMNGLVARDVNGASPYAMGVIRPNHAGLSEDQALAIVERVRRETGLPLEVVNYNIRGRQYSVTGDVRALNALADTLAPLSKPTRRGTGREKAYIDVPGIDVPFHSSLLRDGVPVFRATLDRVLPLDVRPDGLIGRYIPNLVAEPFALSRAFVERVLAVSQSDVLSRVVGEWKKWEADPARLARTLLIELLAYQFASPVKWIQTQDVLFTGEDAVDVFVEIGVKEQPTIANMALITLSDAQLDRKPRVLNSEGELAELVGPKAIAVPLAAVAEAKAPATPTTPATSDAHVPAATTPCTATGIADVPYSVRDALFTQLALQAKLAPSQIRDNETLDELVGGNSARRNQVLADVGHEFGIGAIDGAHELPLSELAKGVAARAPRYAGHGKYLSAKVEQAVSEAFGAARLAKKDVTDYLAQTWGLGAGRTQAILSRIALNARDGDSARGGPLAGVPAKGLNDRTRALAWIDDVVAAYGRELAISLQKPSAGGAAAGAAVIDSAALDALEAKIFGNDGVLAQTTRFLNDAIGVDVLAPLAVTAPERDAAAERLALYDKEHGPAYEAAIKPIFDAQKHVAFTSAWAWVKRDVMATAARVFAGAALKDEEIAALGRRLDDDAAKALEAYRTVATREGNTEAATTFARIAGARVARTARPKTAVVTGAGPGSIAVELVRLLLARGDRVVVTTSTYGKERLAFFKRLYQEAAIPGAELHVVPANQGSLSDMDALVKWLFEPRTEAAGAGERRIKEAWLPDVLVPFAAMGEAADVTGIGERSLAVLRVLLVGLERLLGAVAAGYGERAVRDRLCRVVLPLSPNHGTFGGDGVYAECKAALETLVVKHESERARWGRFVSLVGARIGWVRGTGLMEANDVLAQEIEQRAGIRTFSNEEMAAELLPLIDVQDAQARIADLSGGLGNVHDLGAIARDVRERIAETRRLKRRRQELDAELAKRLHKVAAAKAEKPAAKALQTLAAPIPSAHELSALPALDHLDLDRVVAVVGYGEVGPWGSSRTRWSMEKDGKLSLEALAELGWMMGFIKPKDDGLGFVDAESNEPVADAELHARYEAKVMQHAGIRVIEPEITGFDPNGAIALFDVHLDKDFQFPVPTRQMAEEIRAADPEHTRVIVTPEGACSVVRLKGTKVKMPRALRLDRHVAGQIPSGWSAARYGVPQELIAQVDRATLFNLIATVEAFLAAGMEPEEIYSYLHPSRVGSTQSAGLGSMNQLRRMYRDFYMGVPRQNDTLQETLINVISGYVVQSYLGSYGPMSFPVGACATAAVSVSDACDKILGGQADLMVTGGVDDYAIEGNVGFTDMGATAPSDELYAMGIDPAHASRPNDRRRRGFVEAQGAGAMVLCRASLALKMGLPVYGIVAHASSHGDGINLSVPAPGIGVLSAAAECEAHDPQTACDFSGRRSQTIALREKRAALVAIVGEAQADTMLANERRRLAHDFYKADTRISPLRGALATLGLTPDDVAFVSKHDTSTAMNDVGENRLHHWLQEKLGRTEGLPLAVISQKALTGHSKGGAAGWQMNGVLQAMQSGVIPANKSLEDVDPAMAAYSTMAFTDAPIAMPRARMKAALVTSLGFGHIGAIVLLGHPFLFWRMLDADQTAAYRKKLGARMSTATTKLQRVLGGSEAMFKRRTERPFSGKDGTPQHLRHEADVLMNAASKRDEAHYA